MFYIIHAICSCLWQCGMQATTPIIQLQLKLFSEHMGYMQQQVVIGNC